MIEEQYLRRYLADKEINPAEYENNNIPQDDRISNEMIEYIKRYLADTLIR